MNRKWKVRIEYGPSPYENQRYAIERIVFAEGPYIAVAECVLRHDGREINHVTCEEIKPEGA